MDKKWVKPTVVGLDISLTENGGSLDYFDEQKIWIDKWDGPGSVEDYIKYCTDRDASGYFIAS